MEPLPAYFTLPAAELNQAVTLGMDDILASRRIRSYGQGGRWQQTVLRMALLGDEDLDYPVTLLQDHPDFAIVVTAETAQPPICGVVA